MVLKQNNEQTNTIYVCYCQCNHCINIAKIIFHFLVLFQEFLQKLF